MKKHIFLFLIIVSSIFLGSIESASAIPTVGNGYNNSTSNPNLSLQTINYINQKYPSAIQADGTISEANVRIIQADLGLTGPAIDGKLGTITASALSAATPASPSPATPPASTTPSPSPTAGTNTPTGSSAGGTPASPSSTNSTSVQVVVTEKIPGAECTCIATQRTNTTGPNGGITTGTQAYCGDPKTRKYTCTVEKGLGAFQNMFRDIVKWVVYIIMLLGVVAIAGAGILWMWGSDSEEYTKKAKGWVMNILIGLIILFTFRYILGFLAPWIFQ